MPHHQHALVRYVTLDRCLSRLRLSKEELIGRCSEAVSTLTGDHRRISEKTFFNDIRALREGIVLGREAPIVCIEGCYRYDEHGFSIFHADAKVQEVADLEERLELMEIKARMVLARIERHGVDKRLATEIRAILESEGTCAWVHLADKEENEKGVIGHAKEVAMQEIIRHEKESSVNRPKDPEPDASPNIMEQRSTPKPDPPSGLDADALARWFLQEEYAPTFFYPKRNFLERLKRKAFRRKAMRVAQAMIG